jgi:hypothetical protein
MSKLEDGAHAPGPAVHVLHRSRPILDNSEIEDRRKK